MLCAWLSFEIVNSQHTIASHSRGVGIGKGEQELEQKGRSEPGKALLGASQMGEQTLSQGESGASSWMKANEVRTAGLGESTGAGARSWVSQPRGLEAAWKELAHGARLLELPLCQCKAMGKLGWRRLVGSTWLTHRRRDINTQLKPGDKFWRSSLCGFVGNHFD